MLCSGVPTSTRSTRQVRPGSCLHTSVLSIHSQTQTLAVQKSSWTARIAQFDVQASPPAACPGSHWGVDNACWMSQAPMPWAACGS